MKYHLVASGSKGNCCIIQAGDTRLVIDCGSTKRHLTHSFHNLGIDYTQVDGVLITHSHIDHVSSIRMFADTEIYSPFLMEERPDAIRVIPYQPFTVGEIVVTPVPLSHDSGPTIGFVLRYRDEMLVYVTDTGYVREHDFDHFRNADYYIFESNHDPEMLMRTRRPIFTKNRILSDSGHLCNQDSANVLSRLIGPTTKEIVLAHLSQEANDEFLAYSTLFKTLQEDHPSRYLQLSIRCAKQYETISGGQ
jgi:phosphoribosyl 1,2-cyclic phosphodiesterase